MKIDYFCPECGNEVVEFTRVCFGLDPHITYKCLTYRCGWSGRNPQARVAGWPEHQRESEEGERG